MEIQLWQVQLLQMMDVYVLGWCQRRSSPREVADGSNVSIDRYSNEGEAPQGVGISNHRTITVLQTEVVLALPCPFVFVMPSSFSGAPLMPVSIPSSSHTAYKVAL